MEYKLIGVNRWAHCILIQLMMSHKNPQPTVTTKPFLLKKKKKREGGLATIVDVIGKNCRNKIRRKGKKMRVI